MNLNNILEDRGEWSKAGSNLGKLINTTIETSIAKAEGNLHRTKLVEGKTTELFELKLDLKIQELRNELNDITPDKTESTPLIPSVDDVMQPN